MGEKMDNRVVVITGGFGAVGRAVTEAALGAGARVALIDQAPEGPRETRQLAAIGGVDLSSAEDASAAMSVIVDRFGGIDALINLAGGFRWGTLADGDASDWTLLFRMNAVSCATACRSGLPYLLRSPAGRIVNVGANAALRAGAGMGPYAASKSAVHRLTESLADELKCSRVTVNAVLPSIIDTPANRRELPDADHSLWVTLDEVASAIMFLASRSAGGITGALIPVTGRV
jgi:3-oxoacyl-[acyl-carrier protein] reductase